MIGLLFLKGLFKRLRRMSLSANKAALFGKGAGGGGSTTPPPSTAKPVSSTRGSVTTGNNSAILAAARAKRVAEAEEFCGKAETYLKTSFLQWKPDYVAAATMFERASDLYKQADDNNEALNMMLRASDCHEGYKALASVAVANTKAAALTKAVAGTGGGREKQTAELLAKAAEFWGLSGDLAKYGETLAKAAKELEDVNRKEAQELYTKSISILCPELGPPTSPLAAEILRNCFSFLVRQRMFAEALVLSKEMVRVFQALELESAVFKVLASVTVIQLAQGDPVKAQQTYLQEHMSVPGYLQSRECVLADDLTMAFSGNDIDKLDKCKKMPEVNYLDFEVQRLCKGLSLFDSVYTDETPISVKQPAAPVSGVKSSSGSAGSSAVPAPVGTKSDLFGPPKPKPAPAAPVTSASSSGTNSGRPSPPPPPPLPAPSSASPTRSTGSAGPADLDDIDIPDTGSDDGANADIDLDDLHIAGEDTLGEEYTMEPLVEALDGTGFVQESGKFAHIADADEVPQEEEEDEIDLS